ncbi:hypothetical protein EUGRSUZ_B00315 [Eucalyptus grandis]|uniref:Uncharacterized protein n=2 Tax=Eucalyptus grandis TaxID=71139 RepID=A0A059CYZ1_EUCGR|nr:hypothetical protein EUGRSUZ_B00315 [Eucalyptus grandis]
MQASAMLSSSPSLSSYSTSRLAEIAARVVDELELGLDPDPFCCDAMDFGLASAEQLLLQPPGEEAAGEESASTTQFGDEDAGEAGEGGEEEEEEFEFAFVSGGPGSSPISADEIFYNGQIMPVYPVFNRNLLLSGVSSSERDEDGSKKTTTTTKKLRLPLKKLLSQEREWSSSSSSSSESDELDGLTPGSYCVWRPPQSSAAVGKRCKKSNSTGTSKRWRFRDLLQLNRSHSDGEGTFLVVAPAKKRDKAGESKRVAAVADDDGTTATDGKPAGKDEEKRKPLLPLRADLVGFFANARGLSRNLKLNPL